MSVGCFLQIVLLWPRWGQRNAARHESCAEKSQRRELKFKKDPNENFRASERVTYF